MSLPYRSLGLLALLALTTTVGCAASEPEETTESSEDELDVFGPGGIFGGGGFGVGSGGRGQTVAQPSGLFTTIVNANGSGCPKGSWQAGISPDGKTFTITFSAYETRVGPGQSIDTKDCAIDVAMIGTRKLKFEVAALYYQGFVLLENERMSAVQTADYSFNPAGILTGLAGIDVPLPNEVHSENVVSGPSERSYTNTDTVSGSWSSCKKANALHIRTRLKLRNDPDASGSGYFNTSTVDGSMSFAWKLNWERC